ncbi:hypothetical protein ACFL1R_10055 [Candidatus Latescibacterota bacterium]
MIKQWIADCINPIGNSLFSLIMTIPMSVVRIIFLCILAFLALWVLSLPAQYPDNRKNNFWYDLRFFALGVLILQSLFYLIF